jgi:diguanylate cyclase (GGDEF)-like protein
VLTRARARWQAMPGASYGLAGGALGAVFCASGIVADMEFRRWTGSDPSFLATFSSTLMHALALTSPFVVGRIFLEIGRHQRAMREQLERTAQGESRVREQALHDPMTGLFNRAYLVSTLEEGLATGEWRRRGAFLLMFDLNDFKHVNDTFGHRAGDVVLTTIAARLRAACKGDDFAVRLGGDEFTVVHFADEWGRSPGRFAEELIASIGADIAFDGLVLNVGTSIGISRIGVDANNWSDVIISADLALYEAKRESVSAYRSFVPSMREGREANAATEVQMKRGLDRDEFELHYQPIYGAKSGVIRSFEALVRWNHPERGLVPPTEFIPLAETSGFIVQLGRRILHDACMAAASWPKPIGVAVNLSPIQFKDLRLVHHVREALEASGLAPGRLDLEITESVLLEQSPRLIKTVEELRELGVRITMDDFGTGFSSLNNLRRIRFDRIKIDRCFTRELTAAESDAEIVRTIVRLSKTLRMETVLEGVETERQVEFARDEDMTEVQGFFYAKPMRRSEIEGFLERRTIDEGVALSA